MQGASIANVGELGLSALGLEPTDQQRRVWRLLGAVRQPLSATMPTYPRAVIEMPRRCGKTDALLAWLVGRCATTPGLSAAYAAQHGLASRERYLRLETGLNRAAVPCTFYRAGGRERVNFANGSVLRFLPPKASTFRGDAIDLVVLDEAQEVDPADADDLLGGVLPVQDTRPDAQLVVSGTPGAGREGLLWTALQRAESGAWGVLRYAAPDDADLADEQTWLDCHPGIGTLTTIEVIRERFAELPLEQFGREYRGRWPSQVSRAGINSQVWQGVGVDEALPTPPASLVLAYDVALDRSSASVAMAWLDGDRTSVLLASHRDGTDWLVERLLELARRHRAPIFYDAAGPALDVAEALSLSRPAPTLEGLGRPDYSAACEGLVAAATDGRLRHWSQGDLDDAVVAAYRLPRGDGGWVWGRRRSAATIAPLVAVTLAAAGARRSARPSRVLVPNRSRVPA